MLSGEKGNVAGTERRQGLKMCIRDSRWNPDAKGAWIGIKPETTRGDLLRSVLECVTKNLSICLDILRTQMDIKEITVVGGGAKGAVWRQIMADIYNARIKVPSLLEEGSSMGAAVIGGVGTGIFKDFTAIDRFINIESVHTPDSGAVEALSLIHILARQEDGKHYKQKNTEKTIEFCLCYVII